MAIIENKFSCDLSKPVQAQALKGNVFSLDNLGSRISVLIYENGQPATISGSITANCILPDEEGSTVNVNGGLTTENGGSKAYVDIPQSCLLIPGILKIAIKCTSSSVITTLAAIVANVYMTKTDNVITPSQQIIDDWNAEISAAIAGQNAQISDLKSAFSVVKDNAMPGVTYEWGNTNSSGIPATEITDQHRISNLIPVKAGTKILFKSSNTYNTADVITVYTADGVFSSRTVYTIDKDTADVVVDIPIDGYIRRTYALKSGNAMPEEVDEHIRALWELRVADTTKILNELEKVYDANSEELGEGYIYYSSSQGAYVKQTTDRWHYVVHNCKQGDIFVYNGYCASPALIAVFYNSTNVAIGAVEAETAQVYKGKVIEIPFFCTRVSFSWFTADGTGSLCSLYRYSANKEIPVSTRQNELLNLIGIERYNGLKININGDSISTASAGKWSKDIQYQINSTFKLIGIGGTRMTGEINSTTRIANLDEDADIVLTNGGANDWAQNITIGGLETLDDPSTFAGAVQLYIERVITRCPNARIICMGTNYVNFKNRFDVEPLIGEKNDNGDRITDFNDMYRKVCEYNSIEFINIYELCGINRYNYTTYLEQDSHDYGYGYVHPNAEGGIKYLNVILGYLFYNKNS